MIQPHRNQADLKSQIADFFLQRRAFSVQVSDIFAGSDFSVDGDMAVKFLSATKRLLNGSGQALFVVNNFIPLEQKAKAYFRYIDVLANNGSFKLVALAHQPVKN